MKIAVQPLKIDSRIQEPKYFEATLEQFFVIDAHDYQESSSFPFEQEGREGGCQFSFDRDPDSPMRCIDCDNNPCHCGSGRRPRYALQRFTETRIYVLDIDLNNGLASRRTNWIRDDWCKYHSLLWNEEMQLRQMERRLMDLNQLSFFYRTKCNGFRVGFESPTSIRNVEDYERLCRDGVSTVRECTPDGEFGSDAWFHVDGVSYKGQAYWSYPRVHNPIWLNPNRTIP